MSELKHTFLVFAMPVIALLLTACTLISPRQQAGIDLLIQGAVIAAVHHDGGDNAEWHARALKIITVAKYAKRILDKDETVAVSAIVDALTPAIARLRLTPGEQLAADLLVQALAQIAQHKLPPDAPTTTTIKHVLDVVIATADIYTS